MDDVPSSCVSCRSSCIFKGEAWEGHWRAACISLMSSLQMGKVPDCCKTSLRELICNSRQENSLLPETLSSFSLWELGKQRATQCSIWWVFDPWLLHVSHLNNLGEKQGKDLTDVTIKEKKSQGSKSDFLHIYSGWVRTDTLQNTVLGVGNWTVLTQTSAWILRWPRSQRLKAAQSLN